MNLEIIESNVKKQQGQTTLIFVHGAYHGSWCWEEKFLSFFDSKGCKCYAVSLRGHGKSEGREQIDSFSLDDYADDVMRVIDMLECSPILIGHSMGGAIVQKVAAALGNRISGMILLASIPPKGMMLSLLGLLIKHPQKAKILMNLEKASDVTMIGNLFFSDAMDRNEVEKYCKKLIAESKLASRQTVSTIVHSNAIPKDMPVLIIGAKNDAMLTRGQTKKLGKFYNKSVEWMERSGHDLMLDIEWKQVAGKIFTFIEQNKKY